jgi:hypothetical protein
MGDMFENGDYLRIQALVADYVWNFDMARIDAVLPLFEEDAVLQDTAGNIYVGHGPIGDYFRQLVATPAFRGRQHHIDNMRLVPTETGYDTRSYWTVTKWRAGDNQKVFDVVGHSFDRFKRGPQGFRFAERRLFYWRDADCPWELDGTAV